MKTSVYIATSVDGFIAREDGSVDWLSPENNINEDYGYQAFMHSVDALVMGRNTFDMILSHDVWPYGEKPVIILTSRPLEIPKSIINTVSTLSGSPNEIIKELTKQNYEHLYIDGGKTIQEFIKADLIQTLNITKIPILIGSGIPLFTKIPQDIKLQHLKTITYENGFVQSKYKILKSIPVN